MKRVVVVIVACVAAALVILAVPGVLAWAFAHPSTADAATNDKPIALPASATSTNATAAASDNDAGVTKVGIDDGAGHWSSRGFVEMTPPVRLPSDDAETDRIAVWLKVPDGALVAVRKDANGHTELRFPPGTTADRVESFRTPSGDAVVDVRGETIIDQGVLWHVFVPTADTASATLVGWEWRRDDASAQQFATDALVAHLQKTKTLHEVKQVRARVVEDYRKNNDCGRCHRPDRPENLEDPRAIHRATDDSGFFVPMSVLVDTAPLETHRPRDMNADDPFISLECPEGRQPILDENDNGARRWRCPDGRVPVGTLDVKAALKQRDAHAQAVCASRKYLAQHMDAAGRASFASALAECGID